MYSTVTPDWFAVFLMTMLLWQSELKSPAYRFPLSRRCHSSSGTVAASVLWFRSLPFLPAAKWKKTSQRLIYMVMVWSTTFCPRPVANQMAKYGLCSWKKWTFPTVRTSVSMTVGVKCLLSSAARKTLVQSWRWKECMAFWIGQVLICLEPLDTQSLKLCHSFFQEQIIPFPFSLKLSLDCNADLMASNWDWSQHGAGWQIILDLEVFENQK